MGGLIARLERTFAEAREHGGIVGLMIHNEQAKGATIVPVGSVAPFAVPAEDWTDRSIISTLNGEARIVAIISLRPGSLRRLVDAITRVGLVPVIVEPVGPTMPAIMRHWGWRKRVVGAGEDRCEEWLPRPTEPHEPNP